MRKTIYLLVAAVTALFSTVAFPAAPSWWSTGNFSFVSGNVNNYAPLNVGQLKNVATQTKGYLDLELAGDGGNGSAIPTFTHNTTTDYAPANLGQLKVVAQPIYDRLVAVGYNTTANLIAQGYPSNWPFIYPWDPGTPTADNYAPVNIGQLKMVFSFDLGSFTLSSNVDGYGDGLPDSWENSTGLNRYNTDPNSAGGANGDYDGDGITNYGEYILGSDPKTADSTGKLTTYSYDADGQLQSVSGNQTSQMYQTDAEGNLLQSQ